jgi:hypothetical protein
MPADHVFALAENFCKSGLYMNIGYPAKTLLPRYITENLSVSAGQDGEEGEGVSVQYGPLCMRWVSILIFSRDK